MENLSKKLQSINLSTIDLQDLVKIIGEIIGGHNRKIANELTCDGFFRARKINNIEKEEELDYVKCIWYRNWSEVKPEDYTYNRCTDKGENFFYSSNVLEAAVREVDVKDGDRLLVGEFHTDNKEIKIACQFAGIETLREIKYLKEILSRYDYKNTRDQEIERVFATKFKERISVKEDYLYKLTIAISKILLDSESIKCLIYPSVVSNYEFVNFGIKPDFVDNYMFCHQAFIYNISVNDKFIILTPEKWAKSKRSEVISPKNWELEWRINSKNQKVLGKKYYKLQLFV